jgi:hypothetical protein
MVAAAVLFAALPAVAQYQPSRPYEVWGPHSLTGVYAGLGGGGQLMIVPGDNALGFNVEGRLGYSFGVPFQIYLSGSVDSSSFGNSFNSPGTLTIETIAGFLQYHLYARPSAMVYIRGGVGIGLSSSAVFNGSTGAGLAGAGGFGVEIRLAPGLYLSPELYYKSMYLSGGGNDFGVQSLGLQLSFVFY